MQAFSCYGLGSCWLLRPSSTLATLDPRMSKESGLRYVSGHFVVGFSTPLRVRMYVHLCISLVSLYAHRLSPCTVTHDVVSLFPLPKVHRAFLAASVVLTDIGFIVIFVGLSGFLNFGVS